MAKAKLLSEAMAQGIKKTRPATVSMIDKIRPGKYAACALGAAFINGGLASRAYSNSSDRYKTLELRFPALIEMAPTNGLPKSLHGCRLTVAIYSLNDTYKWSRTKIVKWLRSNGL